MLAAALIVFREVFEAGVVIGIVLSATPGVPGRGRWIAGGVAAGVLGAMAIAAFAGAIGEALDGAGQEVLNAGILLLAAAMLGWHTIWMASHGRALAAEMRGLGQAVSTGQRTLGALAVVVAAAVLREGAEVVLFLYGLVAGGAGWGALLAGGGLGIAGGAAVSVLLYRGLLAIPARLLFRVTTVLLTLLTAGLASQGVGLLIQADLLPALAPPLWDSSALLDERGLPGQALRALTGYTARPLLPQVLVYAAVLAALLLGERLARRPPAPGMDRPAPLR